jgi:putative Holliday junction resolvase
MKIIGVDYGRARIGMAFSDDNQKIAFPKDAVLGKHDPEKNAYLLAKELEKQSYAAIVIGLPLLMNGKDSTMTEEVKKFANLLESLTTKPVILWDERLTSKQIERELIFSDVKRKERTKVVDSMAAALILQSYLDTKNRS